jgi:prevent-host-death family protein
VVVGMKTVTLEKAQSALADLVQKAAHGEQFTITENGEPKAVLSAAGAKRRPTREEVLHAIDNSPIRFNSSWDELKKELR